MSRNSEVKRPEEVANTLALLFAVDDGADISQRGLANRVGVALGLANAMVKRCVGKGLIKIKHAPAKRYAYYLTPRGFAEKTRLVQEYLTTSLDFFRTARAEYTILLENIAVSKAQRIVFVGIGELAEIALLAASEIDKKPQAIIAAGKNVETFHGIPVVQSLQDFIKIYGDVDACVITDQKEPEAVYGILRKSLENGKIFAPTFMHISGKHEVLRG